MTLCPNSMDRTWDYVPASTPLTTKPADTNKLYACVCCALVACIVILILVSMFNDNRCGSIIRSSDGVSARVTSNQDAEPAIEVCSGSKESVEDKDRNEKEFARLLEKYRKVLIMFHAPWCGHCANAKPNFDAASLKSKLPFLKVNCDLMHPHVIQNELFDVQYFPYCVLFDMDKKRTVKHESGNSEADYLKTASAADDVMMMYF